MCDSYVRPCTLVRICDECNYGSFQVRFFKETSFSFIYYDFLGFTSRDVVLFVEDKAFRMHTIAKNAHNKRKIEMDVQR